MERNLLSNGLELDGFFGAHFDKYYSCSSDHCRYSASVGKKRENNPGTCGGLLSRWSGHTKGKKRKTFRQDEQDRQDYHSFPHLVNPVNPVKRASCNTFQSEWPATRPQALPNVRKRDGGTTAPSSSLERAIDLCRSGGQLPQPSETQDFRWLTCSRRDPKNRPFMTGLDWIT